MKLVTYLTIVSVFLSCDSRKNGEERSVHPTDSLNDQQTADSAADKPPLTAADVTLTKELAFDQYTLEDTYPYQDSFRRFQWEKIKERLALIDNFQRKKRHYAVLQNYKNRNGEAPVVANYVRNAYKRISDTLGIERYQSVPLYRAGNPDVAVRYGRDGSLVELLSADTAAMVKVAGLSLDGTWEVPERYVTPIGDSLSFNHLIVVDVTHQNICTIERSGEGSWQIRSMNPATTGRHKPPYSMETPTGLFVLQEKKRKMLYLKEGTQTIQGYAPYAVRFSNGGYVHGVPTQSPEAPMIEYSASLGTVPRSHMCVRTASSHARFIYDRAKPLQTLILVMD